MIAATVLFVVVVLHCTAWLCNEEKKYCDGKENRKQEHTRRRSFTEARIGPTIYIKKPQITACTGKKVHSPSFLCFSIYLCCVYSGGRLATGLTAASSDYRMATGTLLETALWRCSSEVRADVHLLHCLCRASLQKHLAAHHSLKNHRDGKGVRIFSDRIISYRIFIILFRPW